MIISIMTSSRSLLDKAGYAGMQVSHRSVRSFPCSDAAQNGCTYSVLSSMEGAWIADYGRDRYVQFRALQP